MQTAPISFQASYSPDRTLKRIDYSDQFQISLSDLHGSIDLFVLARTFLKSTPKWCRFLMGLRNQIAPVFGIKVLKASPLEIIERGCVPKQRKIGLFPILDLQHNEMLIGEDDRHLNFRVRLQLNKGVAASSTKTFVIKTTVQFNNRFGRIYFNVVKPVHRLIVQTMMLKMAHAVNGTSVTL